MVFPSGTTDLLAADRTRTLDDAVERAGTYCPRTGDLGALYLVPTGGPADFFAEPTSQTELTALIRRCRQEDIPVRMLGAGSRVLISDEGVRGMIIHLSAPAFGEIEVEGAQIRSGGVEDALVSLRDALQFDEDFESPWPYDGPRLAQTIDRVREVLKRSL